MMLFVYYMLVFELFHLILYGIYRITVRIPVFGNIYQFFEHIGVYFHEISHLLMIKLVRMPAKIQRITINKGDGSVDYQYTRRASFLQILFVGFSPLIIGTLLILFTTYLFTFSGLNLSVFTRILLFVIGFSIVTVISPSWSDLKRVTENVWEYPIIAVRQLIFLFLAWIVQIEIMKQLLIENPLIEFPILFGVLLILELIYALCQKVFRIERKFYTQSTIPVSFNPNDPIVMNYVEQDIVGNKSRMTTSNDLHFKRRFSELMDSFFKTNSEF